MPTFSDNGVQTHIGEDVNVFRTNISTFDREMLKSMQKARNKYYRYPIPSGHTPAKQSGISPIAKYNLIKKRHGLAMGALNRKLQVEKAKAFNEFKRKVKSGENASDARAEYEDRVASIRSDLNTKAGFMKRAVSAIKKDITKTVANASLAYARSLKSRKEQDLRALEQRIRETKELISSGKVSAASGEVILKDLQNQMQKKLSEIKDIDYSSKMKAITTMKKMGKISPAVAAALIKKKKMQLKRSRRPRKTLKRPNFGIIAIDAATGRIVAPNILKEQFVQHKKNGNKQMMQRIAHVLRHPVIPGQKVIHRVSIELDRTIPVKTGSETVYTTKDSQVIATRGSKLAAPNRPIPADDVPASRFLTREQPLDMSEVVKLNSQAKGLLAQFGSLYRRLKQSGSGKSVQFVMKVGELNTLKNEIKQSERTHQPNSVRVSKLKELVSMLNDINNEIRRELNPGRFTR